MQFEKKVIIEIENRFISIDIIFKGRDLKFWIKNNKEMLSYINYT